MKSFAFLPLAAALALVASPAAAGDRYAQKPPVVVSPDLSAPWVMQLKRAPVSGQRTKAYPVASPRVVVRPRQQKVIRRVKRSDGVVVQQVNAPARAVAPGRKIAVKAMNPIFLPQQVTYSGGQAAGTIIIDTNERFLYLVQGGGKARRYGVGVGKPGFEWAGTHSITQKREWPDWRPPAEMIERVRRQEGRILPVHMAGGPENPLGARAMYLGSTLYRIHGTNQPWTIGNAVSSGCIRMRNEDVIDLYERVRVGTKVIVM